MKIGKYLIGGISVVVAFTELAHHPSWLAESSHPHIHEEMNVDYSNLLASQAVNSNTFSRT